MAKEKSSCPKKDENVFCMSCHLLWVEDQLLQSEVFGFSVTTVMNGFTIIAALETSVWIKNVYLCTRSVVWC